MDKKVIIYLVFVGILTFVIIINILGVTKNDGIGLGTNRGKCYEIPDAVQTLNVSCQNEFDDGLQPFSFGSVKYNVMEGNEEILSDSCTKEGNLIEYDCENDVVSIYLINCLNGCENGVCRQCK